MPATTLQSLVYRSLCIVEFSVYNNGCARQRLLQRKSNPIDRHSKVECHQHQDQHALTAGSGSFHLLVPKLATWLQMMISWTRNDNWMQGVQPPQDELNFKTGAVVEGC